MQNIQCCEQPPSLGEPLGISSQLGFLCIWAWFNVSFLGLFCGFRFVLAVGSAVFDAMFNGGMATTSTEIELPDVEPAAFLALLK